MKSIQVIIEEADHGFFGRIEGRKSYLPVTYATSINVVLQNLKELIKDYQINEKDGDDFWHQLYLSSLEFEVVINTTTE